MCRRTRRAVPSPAASGKSTGRYVPFIERSYRRNIGSEDKPLRCDRGRSRTGPGVVARPPGCVGAGGLAHRFSRRRHRRHRRPRDGQRSRDRRVRRHARRSRARPVVGPRNRRSRRRQRRGGARGRAVPRPPPRRARLRHSDLRGRFVTRARAHARGARDHRVPRRVGRARSGRRAAGVRRPPSAGNATGGPRGGHVRIARRSPAASNRCEINRVATRPRRCSGSTAMFIRCQTWS